MHISSRSLLFLSAVMALAQDSPKPQFTARELFYSAASDSSAGSKPAAAKPPTPTKAVPPPPKKAAPPAQTAAVTPPPPSQPAAQHTQPTTLPGGGTIIKASVPATAPAPATGTPLGLKYIILKQSGSDMVEVSPDTIFHTGDRIQLSVQTNGPGYLYVVSQGASGTWTPMFPSPEVADGNNYVSGWNASILPTKSYMRFDPQTGTEKLFVVFSRTPEDGLEKLIYSLQGSKVKPAADKAEPKAAPKQMVQIAEARVDDGTVGQLRNTYTRDLIIERVDDKTPADKSAADKKENAVYVVNPTGSSNSRVVADINLVHQ